MALTVGLPHAFAILPPVHVELPNYDRRAGDRTQLSAGQLAAADQLRASVRSVAIDVDGITGGPKWIHATQELLSGANGAGGGISAQTIAALPANDPNRVLKAFINEHTNLFGFSAQALNSATLKRDFVTPHSGARTVVWEQQLDGIPVFEGTLIAHTTSRDALVSVSSGFLPNLASAADQGTPGRALAEIAPPIPAEQAVAVAAQDIGERLPSQSVIAVDAPSSTPTHRQHFRSAGLNGETEAEFVWLPMDDTTMRLCWKVTLTSRARGEMYQTLIDAQTGEALVRHCLTEYISAVTYRVYTSDSPSPFSPGNSTPITFQPPLVDRSLVTFGALNTNASPNGWIDDGGNETRGNNVDAHADHNNDNIADLPRPQGTSRVFDFPLDLTQAPSVYPTLPLRNCSTGTISCTTNFTNSGSPKRREIFRAIILDVEDRATMRCRLMPRTEAERTTPICPRQRTVRRRGCRCTFSAVPARIVTAILMRRLCCMSTLTV